MDLTLTKNGDLLLQEIETTSNHNKLYFKISPNMSSVCLKFDIQNYNSISPISEHTLKLNFDFCPKHTCFSCPALENEKEIKQMCYNAIRTQIQSVKSAQTYGSVLHTYMNQTLTKETLKELEVVAKNAIKDFAPNAIVQAFIKHTHTGQCQLTFLIQVMQHELKLNYII